MTTQTLLQDIQHGVPSGNYDGSSLDFASDAANGPGYYQGNAGTQTIAVRVTDFEGLIQLQGTLDCLPDAMTNWVTLAEFDTSDSSTTYTQTVTVEGQFTWIRARVLGFENGTINSVVSSYAGASIDTCDSDANIGIFNTVTANAVYVGAGGVTSTGNVQGTYIIGDGSQLTNLPSGNYSNANVSAFLAAFGSNVITTSGLITGNLAAPDGNTSVLFNREGVIGAAPYFSYDYAANTLYVRTGSFTGLESTGVEGLYVGLPNFSILGSDVLGQFTGDSVTYSQVNLQNINSGTGASADYIITADNGTDSTYYLDIGLAGSNHADPDFFGDTSSVNDAYIYVTAQDQAGPSTGSGPGNLIIGSTNGLVKTFVGNTAQANVITTVDSGGLSVSGNITVANIVKTTSVTYSTLTAVAGARAFISDANLVALNNFGAQVSGGGSNAVPVWSNGTNWYIG